MWAWLHVQLLPTKVSSSIIPISLISTITQSGMFVFYPAHHMSIKHISVSTDNLPTDAESVANHHGVASHAVEDVFIFKTNSSYNCY